VPRLRSSLAAPGSTRLVGALVALAGVALLIVGVVALGGGDDGSPGAAPAPPATSRPPASASSAATVEPTPTAGTGVGSAPAPSTAAPTVAPTTVPRTTPPPAPPTATRPSTARAPLTVLNNSTISGLADRAAREAQTRGWQVAQVGNFAGRLPATTVYYTPGSATEEAAARQLAREFPQVAQVLPRYAGLPPTPAGIVLVVTQTW
jgi:hypothetical protein